MLLVVCCDAAVDVDVLKSDNAGAPTAASILSWASTSLTARNRPEKMLPICQIATKHALQQERVMATGSQWCCTSRCQQVHPGGFQLLTVRQRLSMRKCHSHLQPYCHTNNLTCRRCALKQGCLQACEYVLSCIELCSTILLQNFAVIPVHIFHLHCAVSCSTIHHRLLLIRRPGRQPPQQPRSHSCAGTHHLTY